jgi:hypothetical protein
MQPYMVEHVLEARAADLRRRAEREALGRGAGGRRGGASILRRLVGLGVPHRRGQAAVPRAPRGGTLERCAPD